MADIDPDVRDLMEHVTEVWYEELQRLRFEEESVEAAHTVRRLIESDWLSLANVPSALDILFLKRLLPQVVRLAGTCPYPLTRAICTELVNTVCTAKELPVPNVAEPRISYLFDNAKVEEEIDFLDQHSPGHKAKVEKEILESFKSDLRVSNMTRMMAVHPDFLKCFRQSHNFLVGDSTLDGLFTRSERHFLAFMAASRYKCAYLMDIHKQAFIDSAPPFVDTDAWLQGKLPFKLRSLLALNCFLAFRPMLITAEMLEEICTEQDEDTGFRWTKRHLLIAATILIHFHSLCGFVFAMSIHHELDMPEYASTLVAVEDTPIVRSPEEGTSLKERLQLFQKALAESAQSDDVSADAFDLGIDEPLRDVSSGVAALEETFELFNPPAVKELESEGAAVPTHHMDVDDVRTRKLKQSEFSWADDGFPIVSELDDTLARHLADELETIGSLTYQTVGTYKGQDTSLFRSALRLYCLRVSGVYPEEPAFFHHINLLLLRPIKLLCKSIVCSPPNASRAALQAFLQPGEVASKADDLRLNDQIHIVLLAMEAKKEAQLVFFLRALRDLAL
eukprot:m.286895 g.286895  ORF g.286895 m.286895 type:complete len:563 (-) comp15784_c0_seq2:364-2052(-)